MKKRMIVSAVLAGAFALAGCGSDSSDKREAAAMVVGEAVSVYPGDSVTPGSDDTRIAIRHEVGEEVKVVTLLEGSAELLRGDYAASGE